MILAIDPGLKGLGCAELDMKGEVQRGWFIRRPYAYKSKSWLFSEQWMALLNHEFGLPTQLPYKHLVIEGQYLRGRGHHRPEDILRLSFLTGIVTAALGSYMAEEARLFVPSPQQWKGSTPAGVIQQRIYGKLSTQEVERIERPSQRTWYGDILTACGIGKWYIETNPTLEPESRRGWRRKWALKTEPAS